MIRARKSGTKLEIELLRKLESAQSLFSQICWCGTERTGNDEPVWFSRTSLRGETSKPDARQSRLPYFLVPPATSYPRPICKSHERQMTAARRTDQGHISPRRFPGFRRPKNSTQTQQHGWAHRCFYCHKGYQEQCFWLFLSCSLFLWSSG